MDTVSAHSKFNRIWIPVAMLMMIVLTPNIRIPGDSLFAFRAVHSIFGDSFVDERFGKRKKR